jgi:hypothetical protein
MNIGASKQKRLMRTHLQLRKIGDEQAWQGTLVLFYSVDPGGGGPSQSAQAMQVACKR